MFNSASEAISYIENIKRKDKRKDLSRINYLMKEIEFDESDFKIIHIAGTNGKGSTALFLKEILMNFNYKVGFFISPYITCFNERIEINDYYISDDDLVRLSNKLIKITNKYEKEYNDIVPFFEFVLLLGFLYFKENNIDYLILECGLGGLLDSTNFCKPVCSIITSIGYDHQNSLGTTIEEIAKHKVGIAKENVPLFTYSNDLVNDVLVKYSNNIGAKLFLLDKNDVKYKLVDKYLLLDFKSYIYKTSLCASYQAYNLYLVLNVIEYLFPNYNQKSIDKAISNLIWPGRFEEIDNYLLDGAHNISAIEVLISSLKERNITNITVIFTSLKDKDYPKMLTKLDEIASDYRFFDLDDFRKENPIEFTKHITKKYKIYKKIDELLDINNELVLVTGSLHFVSLIRKYLLEK